MKHCQCVPLRIALISQWSNSKLSEFCPKLPLKAMVPLVETAQHDTAYICGPPARVFFFGVVSLLSLRALELSPPNTAQRDTASWWPDNVCTVAGLGSRPTRHAEPSSLEMQTVSSSSSASLAFLLMLSISSRMMHGKQQWNVSQRFPVIVEQEMFAHLFKHDRNIQVDQTRSFDHHYFRATQKTIRCHMLTGKQTRYMRWTNVAANR